MTPKTGAIRPVTLRLFLPGGGCALPGLRSVRPAFNLASNPPVAPLTGASPVCSLRHESPPGPCKRSAAGHYQFVSGSRRSPGSASQSAASEFSTLLRCPV
ncbi:TPA: hypothetical protein MH636_17455 [Klebsiella pneumoniae]|nr:hypothetical protein [Klebsiella pneumoniae]HBX6203699.1 hypothetical protein [Klebsiella pneumoniae]